MANRNLTGTDGPVIGLETCSDLFEKLEFEGKRLASAWHSYDAFNFIVTAWHLEDDWVSNTGTRLSKTKRGGLPPEMLLVRDVLRDLARGSKHFKLNPSSVRDRRVETVHDGLSLDEYSYMF